MPTTKTNFYLDNDATNPTLTGTAVAVGPKIFAATENDHKKLHLNVAQGKAETGGYIDLQTFDGKADGFAKNGAVALALSGTTAQSIDLTNTTANTPAASAGDTAFSTINRLVVTNFGAGSVTVSPGASNPANIGMGGTSPTVTVPSGCRYVLEFAPSGSTGNTVDSTHKVITITPAASASVGVAIHGA